MYNLKKIREINTLKLYSVKDETSPKKLTFSAEVPPTNDLRLDFKTIIEDPYAMNLGRVATAALNLMGMAPAIDVPAKFAYRGSSPVTFSVPCFLRLKNDPNEDLKNPLIELMKLMLPSRGVELTQYVNQFINTAAEGINQLTSMLGLDTNLATDTNVAKYFGQIYTLNAPWPYGVLNGDSRLLTLTIGSIRFDGVVLESVSIGIPTMLYEDGWPDHVSLSLSFRSIRSATVDSFSTIFTPISKQ